MIHDTPTNPQTPPFVFCPQYFDSYNNNNNHHHDHYTKGYVDPDEAPMKKIGSIFGWNKKKEEVEEPASAKKKNAAKGKGKGKGKAAPAAEAKPKKTGWW